MPKFKVWVQRTTVESGIVEIEADSMPDVEETVTKSREVMACGAVDWQTGESNRVTETVTGTIFLAECLGPNKTARMPQMGING